MAIATLNNIFNGSENEQALLEPVELISWGYFTGSTLDISSTGNEWKDFEYIELVSVDNDASTFYAPAQIPKAVFEANPTSWHGKVGYNDAGANYVIKITATSSTTCTLNYAGKLGIGLLIGYKRRCAATSLTEIVKELLIQEGYTPRTPIELYNDTAQTSSVTLSDSIENYDEVRIYSKYTYGSTSWIHYSTLDVDELVTASSTNRVELANRSSHGTSEAYISVMVTGVSGTTLTLATESNIYTVDGVYKVIGIKHGI